MSYSIESAKKFVENPAQKYKHTALLVLFEEDYFAIMIINNNKKKNSKIKWKLNCKLNKSNEKNKR